MSELFSSEYFIPHGHCFLWKPGLLGLHGLSNTLIALCCLALAAAVFSFVRRTRPQMPRLLFPAAVLFLVGTGLGHVLDVVVLWRPIYWVDGGLRALTAVAAVVAAVSATAGLRRR